MYNVLITPASGTLEFTASNGASIQLVVSESQDAIATLSFVGSSGSLLSVTDSFTGSLGGFFNASGLPVVEAYSDNRVILGEFGQNDLHMSGNKVGIGVQPSYRFHVSGSSTDSSLFEQTISGSIHQTAEGLSYLVAVGGISIISQSNGQILISGSDGGGGGGGSGNTLDQAYDEGGSGAGRLIRADSGAVQIQGTIATSSLEVTGGVNVNGPMDVSSSLSINLMGGIDSSFVVSGSDGDSTFRLLLGADNAAAQFGGEVMIHTDDIRLVANRDIYFITGASGDINISYTNWPRIDGTAGQSLTTNGSGQLYWATSGSGGGGGGSLSQFDLRSASKTMTVSGSPGTEITGTIGGWFNLGIGTYLKITEYGGTTNTDIELYTSSSRASADRFYLAQNKNLNATPHLDLTPWFYEDDETSSQIYYKLTNNGSVTASYDIELVGIGE